MNVTLPGRPSGRSPVRRFLALLVLAALLAGFSTLRDHVRDLLLSASRLPSRFVPVRGEFTDFDGSSPVTWEPCAKVSVLVNPGSFGEAAVDEVRAAFGEIAAVTGLSFVVAVTDEIPRTDWAHSLGGRTAPPVLVGWVAPEETDMLRPGAAASTVANPARSDGRLRIVTGAIALDENVYADFRPAAGAGRTRRNLLLHEIGHLLGLDHVSGAGLMDEVVDATTRDGFHPEERATLAAVYGDPVACRR